MQQNESEPAFGEFEAAIAMHHSPLSVGRSTHLEKEGGRARRLSPPPPPPPPPPWFCDGWSRRRACARGEESKSKEMGQRLRSASLGSAVKVDREISGNENRGGERRGLEGVALNFSLFPLLKWKCTRVIYDVRLRTTFLKGEKHQFSS